MAEIVKTVRIETGNGERSVKSLKKEINDLRDALLNVENGSEEWISISKELTKAQEDLNNVLKAGKQAVDADATSIAGMEARYKSLYQTYRLLSSEQRKSAEGMSMQKELSELSKNLNKTKKDAGNFKDNIGHYAEDMMSAFGQLGVSVGALQGPFKLATLGANGFKGALSVLAKHPIMTAIVVLIGLFKKVADAIKGNEELQMRMNKVMAAFKPIGDTVALVLDKIAGLAVKVAEGMAKVVTWFTKLVGISGELTQAEAELAEKENELIKNRREFETLNSADEARVEELREQASMTENMVEKEKLLNQAKEIQEQINKRNLKLAEDELEIIKQKNALTPSSTEDLDKEAKAQQKVNQERANGEKAVRNLNNAIVSAHKSGSKAAEDEKKKVDELLKTIKENSKTELQNLEEKYKKEKALLEKYHKDTTELTRQYEQEKTKILAKEEAERFNFSQSIAAEMLESVVKPSTAAFTSRIETASSDIQQFLLLVKKMNDGEAYTAKGFVDMIGDYKNNGYKEYINDYIKDIKGYFGKDGSLSKEILTLNELFGLGFTSGTTAEQMWDKLDKVYSKLRLRYEEIKKEQDGWNAEIEAGRKELQAMKDTMDNSSLSGENTLDSYFDKLVKQNKIERDLLRERALAAKEAFSVVEGLSEEELNLKGITLNEQIELEKEYYQALQELRDRDLEAQKEKRQAEKELNEELTESIFELGTAHRQSIGSIVDTYKVLLDAYKQDGKISEQEAKKKAKTLQWLEGIQGAVAVAQIVADTASGWMSINKSLAAEYVLNAETAAATGPAAAATKAALDAKSAVSAGLRKAALLVNGITAATAAVGKTVASIKGLQGDADNAGGGASAAPMLIDSTPYSYTRELQTNVEREEQLNTPIYVRVTDIETAQARVRVVNEETTF